MYETLTRPYDNDKFLHPHHECEGIGSILLRF